MGPRVVVTKSRHPKAVQPDDFAAAVKRDNVPVAAVTADVASALEAAYRMAGPETLIVATGSLFVAAEVIEHVRGDRAGIVPRPSEARSPSHTQLNPTCDKFLIAIGRIGPPDRRHKRNMDNNGRTRAVVTGMGVLSCLGKSVGDYWDGLTSGRSGIAELTLTDTSGYPCKIGGEVRDFDPTQYVDRKESRRLARFSQFAVGAVTEAIANANLDLSCRGLRSRGGPDRMRIRGASRDGTGQSRILAGRHGMRMSPFFIPMMLANMASANISRLFGATGYTNTCATACAAGTQAVGEAGRGDPARRGRRGHYRRRRGRHLRARAGEGFCTIHALTTRNDAPEEASRPFEKNRDGICAG